MSVIKGTVSFYGLKDIEGKLDTIIENLNLKQNFEVKLIMMEAVTNAFIHGNKGDTDKPICLDYELKDNSLVIKVTDCGCGFKNILIPKEINEDKILDEGGRGIYLINCFTDELQFNDNSIIMKKYITKGVPVN